MKSLKTFLLVAFITTGVIVKAKDKFDYKKLLKDYAKAYSAKDEKELARLVKSEITC